MQIIRHVIGSGMLFALLLWGALAVVQPAGIAGSANLMTPDVLVIVSAVETSSSHIRIANPAPKEAVALAPRKCRAKTLPGFSCSLDPVIELWPETMRPPETGSAFLAPDKRSGTNAFVAPQTGPPRSI